MTLPLNSKRNPNLGQRFTSQVQKAPTYLFQEKMLIYWSILVKSKDFCQRFQVSLMLTHAIFIALHNQVSSYLSETILGTGSIGHGGIHIKINPNYQCDKTIKILAIIHVAVQ